MAQGKYDQAEGLLNLALAAQEKAGGPEDLSLTAPLGELAALYRAENRIADAQKLYERSLAIHRKAEGENAIG